MNAGNLAASAVDTTPLWKDSEIPMIVKAISQLIAVIGIVVALVMGLFTISFLGSSRNVISQGDILFYGLTALISGVVAIACYLVGRLPAGFRPRTGIVSPDLVGGIFDIRIRKTQGRSLQQRAYLHFEDSTIAVSGTFNPSGAVQLLVIVVVTIIPLIVFRVGLGIVPALIIASLIGRENVDLALPYNQVNVEFKGCTITLKTLDSRVRKIKFRIAASDGERFYRELQRKYPDLIPTSAL